MDQTRATGIIGTNKKDAVETVNELFADLESGALRPRELDGSVGVESWLTERQFTRGAPSSV
jgi:ferredoxin--NADP+ reductase